MTRYLPILTEALEDWRDLASDRDAVDALLDIKAVVERYDILRTHLQKLRTDPPQFDGTDLEAVLKALSSAQRLRGQIAEANPLEVLVPTLRGFLFDTEEKIEEKFRTYPARIRYAGITILAELWGWTHIDTWPIYSRRAGSALRYLGWQIPAQTYPAFAQAFADLRTLYQQEKPVLTALPLNLEIDQFLMWVSATLISVETPLPKVTPPAIESDSLATLPTPSTSALPIQAPSRRPIYSAIREFGAPYTPLAAHHAWAERPLPIPSASQLAEAEANIRRQLALPPDVIRRAAAHLLAGRHLILTGAPGTGKSHLASLLTSELFGYSPMLVTATAEWSAFDVVGGLVPVANQQGHLQYEIRPGAVYEALRRNWLLAPDGSVCRDANGANLRVSTFQDEQASPGVWLIIDELNRADVDKAFGDLFTALESGKLRVPHLGKDSSILIPLPQDFRMIATLNTRDRHFLFTLSDALKRRFAFVEIAPPSDALEERETLLRRAIATLKLLGIEAKEKRLRTALEGLQPVIHLLRAIHPLGSAPLLASLQYIGSADQLVTLPLDTLLQEALIAEVLPQLEGLRELPLRLLASLFRNEPKTALTHLNDAITQAYGNSYPLRLLHALTQVAAPKLATQTAQLQRASPHNPSTLNQATTLLEQLRRQADALPARHWPLVATQLERWSDERG